jgi:hypothetical protein
MAKCKYQESCGYEFCLDDCCPEFEAAVETNADRIRAMSNRELAAFLAGKFTDHETTKAVQKGEMLTATYISEMAHTWFSVWMQWLREPAEEGQ